MSGGVILAAPASGSGKTVLTLGLLRHLARAGRRVAPAKAGPDYIDPTFHAAAAGTPCLNLDAWAMRGATLVALTARLERAGEFVLCEGVMGLFDGAGLAGAGSTADLAALTGWPVVLVVDARGQAGSAAALIRGFASHRGDVTLAGIVFNRIGGARHLEVLQAALAAALPHIRMLGGVPRRDDLVLPDRHLGLVPAGEHAALDAFLDRAAAHVAAHVDVAALLALARPSRGTAAGASGALLRPLGRRIAVARDAAFVFTYPAMLDGWRQDGATLSFFSPLADEAPDADADAIYLPGGYPELHAGRIAGNAGFLGGLRAAARRGAAIYGECGGYMVLGAALTDAVGVRHAMAGLLPVATSFAARRLHLGYRAMTLAADCALGRAGDAFRGHEFHYASVLSEGRHATAGDGPLFEATDADGAALGPAGLRAGRVMGSFLHLLDRA